jgi:hypothetical protein
MFAQHAAGIRVHSHKAACTRWGSFSSMICRGERKVKQNSSVQQLLGRNPRFLFILTSLLVAGLLLAIPSRAAAQDADPPGRVARLNLIEGSLSFQPAGEQDWVEANHNRPLTTGDNLWADQSSRGELHIGSTALRISSETSISFLNLDDQTAQIQLAQGSMNVRVRRLDQGEAYEVDTPNIAFSILSPGEYRFDVDSTGEATTITVRAGNGEATGAGNSYNVVAGQQAILSGTPDQVNFYAQGAPAPDDFDRFCSFRDEREDRSASARYVSRDVIGYEELDEHGTWRPDPTYGQVWVPTGVAVGWAPYHAGHWAFVAPWGWTWVDDAPWGFAPFHYGRWAYVSGYWGWVPGPIAVRPVYAPALVAFVGGGGFGVSLAIGGGEGVAWFPLGPRDVFVPSYHVSAAYVQNINVSNTTVINRTEVVNVYNNYQVNHVTNVTYVNQTAPGAVMAVSRETFVNARPVAAAAIKVSPQEIQHPQVIKNAAPLTPTRAAKVGPNPPAKPNAKPPAALASHPVVTKRAPSPRAAPVGKPMPTKAVTTVHPAATTSAKPGQPAAKPTEPMEKPAQPAAKPAVPVKPAGPAAKPAQPAQPATKPAAPGRPAEPAGKPAQPAPKAVEPPPVRSPAPAPKPAEPVAKPGQPSAKPAASPTPPKPAPKPEAKPAPASPKPAPKPEAKPAPAPPKPAPKPEAKPSAPPAAQRPVPRPPEAKPKTPPASPEKKKPDEKKPE